MLMTDSWQPTVLHLMPFGANKASVQEDVFYQQECLSAYKGFPRLAVTRVQTHNSQNKQQIARSVSEYASRSKDYLERSKSLSGSRANSEYNARTKMVANPDRSCSVQHLNDQIIYTSKQDLSSNPSKQSENNWFRSSSTNTSEPVKFLPKPNVARSLDGRYFMPQNGFWRAVTLTPGEIDLQKQKVSHSKVHQKTLTKKHKVNVNSLPRSTTPINDYDPDKLNMKHVIAFLQKSNTDVKYESHLRNTDPPDLEMGHIDMSTDMASTSKQDVQQSMLDISDVQNDTRSRHRIRVSDNMPTMEQRIQNSDKDSRSSRKKRRGASHPEKRFRLHRFLTVNSQNLDSREAPSHKAYQFVNSEEQNRSCQNPHLRSVHDNNKCMVPRAQAAGSSNNLSTAYRHIVPTPSFHAKFHRNVDSDERNRKVNNVNGVIRLPNMFDVGNDSDEEVYIKSHEALQIQTRIEENEDNTLPPSVLASSGAKYYEISPTRLKLKESKKLEINLPDQTEIKSQSSDQIRLPMRKEKTLTRETSYMTDLADSRAGIDQRESLLSSVCSLRQEFSELGEYE